MDTDLLKTFLEVERTRHFGRAADKLYLTPSAVSARIRLLEETLGVSLFVRTRHNIQLTRQGERLLVHARRILHDWEQARRELMHTDDTPRRLLRIGGLYSLWDMLLQDWLQDLYRHMPELALQAEVESQDTLIRKLSDDVLDIGVVLDPPPALDLYTEEIARMPLHLLSSRAEQRIGEVLQNAYVQVDWGAEFNLQQQRCFPAAPQPFAQFNLGRLALNFILACGGAAYFPKSLYSNALESGHLFHVIDAPVLEIKIHALYAVNALRTPLLSDVLRTLRQAAPE